MAQGFPSAIGGLTGGLREGVQTGLALAQAKQQKEAFEIEKRQALFGEAMKNLSLVRDKSLPAEFRTKVWNTGVVPGLSKIFPQFSFPEYDKLPEGIDGGVKSLQTIFDKVAKGEMSASAAQHAIGAIELETGQEAPAGIKDLLKTGADHDFQMEKQRSEQEFQLKKEKLKATSGGEAGPTFSKIEGRIIEKYLAKETLSAEEKSIIDNRLVDPIFSQVLNFYSQDIQNLGKKPEERLKSLQDAMKNIREMQKAGLQITPGGAPPAEGAPDNAVVGPAAPAASKEFKNEAGVQKAYKDGDVKIGDEVTVGGQKFIWK